MERKDYKNICLESIPIIKKTGLFIKDQIQQVNKSDIEIKDLNSLVSYVDKEAELQLVKNLKTLLPEAGFITEEDTIKQETKRATWIIDPLDGTSNYLHQIPHYAVSVGLLVDNILKVGIVLDASSDECFYAWEGGGAFLDEKRIRVSETLSIKDALIATGFPYQVKDVAPLIRTLGHFMRHARGLRRFGAAALDLAYVAYGRVDTYYETTLNAWDVAAGALIVKEAGGVVTDFIGGENYIFGKTVIATNGIIHDDVQNIIQKNFI